ncbi:cytochrome P450 [Pseudomonas asiatica]|uniref:cytochrome P450 n=1 Tax=Pseudomonas asiatica TaxID=2219225 RepID=UPI00383AD794
MPSTYAHTAPFPEVIAHHLGPSPTSDHEQAFHHATVCRGIDASAYFSESGITSLAIDNGGLCTFWLGGNLALYQTSNIPLINDEDLMPSIQSNADLFGSFLGSLSINDARRQPKRAVVERVLGSSRFIMTLDSHILERTRNYLAQTKNQIHSLKKFCLTIVTYIDSSIPGVLDLHEKSLTDYLECPTYSSIAEDFFEIASEAISKLNTEAIQHSNMIVNMTRDILESNYHSISTAPATNLILNQFSSWAKPFTLDSIQALDEHQLKELGTIIIATYDTTALSLIWTLAYLGENPNEQMQLQRAIENDDVPLDFAYLVVLEAIRLGGSNPTALWRKTSRPVRIKHKGAEVILPTGTTIWLDRRCANRDPILFPFPEQFSTENIRHAIRNERGTDNAASLLARNRYEINSFSMINTHRNPRKCPGRLFSVRQQALILVELYRLYHVNISGTDVKLATFATMPRPTCAGSIHYSIRR